jgi:hypothetical protein
MIVMSVSLWTGRPRTFVFYRGAHALPRVVALWAYGSQSLRTTVNQVRFPAGTSSLQEAIGRKR